MDKKQLNVLMDDLNNRGVHGDSLELEIARYTALRLPVFAVNFHKYFGAERMSYKLFFERVGGEKSYELTGVTAIHQLPIDIPEHSIKGVKTKQLENQMAEIDWIAYPNILVTGRASAEKEEKIENVNIALAVLLSDESGDGRKIAALLMYKYWPEEMFSLMSGSLVDSLREEYERRSMNFSLDIYPLLTADQVFLMVSERADSLGNMFMELEIPEEFEAEIRNQLYVQLNGFPEKAEVKLQFNTEECFFSLTIPVIKYLAWYGLDDYKVEVSIFPPIAHGVFNGVDSEYLDKKLSVIDWKNDPDLVSLSEDTNEMEFDSEVKRLEGELCRLALDPSGKFIADQLRIKHFLGAPFFEATINDEAWQWLADLPTKTVQFPVDIPVSHAIPMMLGRPVLQVSHEWNSPDNTLSIKGKQLPDQRKTPGISKRKGTGL